MCGAYIELDDEGRIYDCKCCGSRQTVAADDEELLKLVNRANGLRMKTEFAEAESVFRTIVHQYPEEPEGYWGLCLCKYGVNYDADEETAERSAACLRTSMDSILDDMNYHAALERHDDDAKEILRAEARIIDAIQVEAVRRTEFNSHCDVLVCFLEKDAQGQKTSDNILAHNVAESCTDEGLKTLLLCESVKERLGSAHGTYINAAFGSAKVMVAVGTSNDNFYSTEMKSLWSPYLDMSKDNENKTLFVCYKGMDSNELPGEFADLQSFDAKSHNGLKELTDEVTSFVSSYRKREKNKTYLSTADMMIEKAFDNIDEKNWERANEILDKAISIYPKSSRAYFGKFLVTHKMREKDAEKQKFKFALLENESFSKAYSLATGKEKALYEKMLRNNSSLIERAFMWLAEGDFTEANRLASQELIGNSESSQAYLCKFMASRKYKDWDALENANVKFILKNDELFKKAYMYANDEEKAKLDKLVEKNKSIVDKENSRYAYVDKMRKPYVDEFRSISTKLDQMQKELDQLQREADEKISSLKKLEPLKMILRAIVLVAIAGGVCFGVLWKYLGKPFNTAVIAFGISAVVLIVFVVIYAFSGARKRKVEKNAFKRFNRKTAKYKKESEKLEEKLDEVGDVILCATCGNTKKSTHSQCKVCESGAWYRVRYVFTDPDDCRRHMISSMPKSYDFLDKVNIPSAEEKQ